MIIDAHTHVVSHDEHRYPLAVTDLPNGAWFNNHRRDVDELIDEATAAGVGRVVLVQPSGAYSTDNRYLIDAQQRHPNTTVAICTLDVDPSVNPDAPTMAADQLATLVRTSGVRGTRLFALDFAGGDGWINDPRTEPVWETMSELGIPAVVTVFTHQLTALAAMAARYPDVAVCIDHCAFPDLAGHSPDSALAPLVNLASLGNVFIKVTSHLFAEPEPGLVSEAIEVLRNSFGAGRLMWGSDYPQHHDQSYADLVGLAVSAIASFTANERDAFLGGTATSIWSSLSGS